MSSIIEGYINEYTESDNKYKKDLELYKKHIIDIGKSDRPIDITKEDLIQSVIKFNSLKKIGTKNTLKRYISSIKAFYIYLIDKGRQKSLFAEYNITSDEKFIAEICNRSEINFDTITKRDPLPNEIIVELLNKLDSFDYDVLLGQSLQKREWYYKYKSLRIFIKIMLIAPTKKNKITNLNIDDIDMKKRTISLNGYLFDITNSLYQDLNDYLLIRSKGNSENKINDTYLFIHSKSTKKITDSDLNWWFGEFIYENDIFEIKKSNRNLYTFPIEPVMNSALLNLLDNDVNLELVSKINGCSVASIANKFNCIKDNKETINVRINNEIKRNYYYKFV